MPPTVAREVRARSLAAISLTAYTQLWIAEGALRKWLPFTSQPLYVARDLLIVLTIVTCSFIYRPKAKGPLPTLIGFGTLFIVAVGLAQAIVIPVPAAIVGLGLRNYLSPAFLLYLVMSYSNDSYWRTARNIVLFWTPVEAALTVIQVLSPAGSYVNRQIGGEDASFTTAFGVVRASGTFSSPIGLTLFAAIALAFALGNDRGRKIVLAQRLCVMAIIALGGSRAAVLTGGMVLLGYLWWQVRRQHLGWAKGLLLLVSSGLVVVVFSRLAPDVISAFATRFSTAATQENAGQRLWDQMAGYLTQGFSPLGLGAGVNTQAGVALGSGHAWIETDGYRLVSELGLIGFLAASLKLFLGILLIVRQLFSPSVSAVTSTLGIAMSTQLLFIPLFTSPTTAGAFAIAIAAWASSLQHSDGDELSATAIGSSTAAT